MASILVADDSDSIRQLLALMLSDAGHAVEKAADARQAIAALEKSRYDVVLLDQNMPGLTGIEAARLIRDDPRLRATKIVIISADSRLEHGDDSMVAGADAYLDKPITADKLVSTLRLVLG